MLVTVVSSFAFYLSDLGSSFIIYCLSYVTLLTYEECFDFDITKHRRFCVVTQTGARVSSSDDTGSLAQYQYGIKYEAIARNY